VIRHARFLGRCHPSGGAFILSAPAAWAGFVGILARRSSVSHWRWPIRFQLGVLLARPEQPGRAQVAVLGSRAVAHSGSRMGASFFRAMKRTITDVRSIMTFSHPCSAFPRRGPRDPRTPAVDGLLRRGVSPACYACPSPLWIGKAYGLERDCAGSREP
jgi:hypothetical protein